MTKLIINGRFLTGAPTAVNAVARSLTLALNAEITAGAASDWHLEVAIPKNAEAAAAEASLPYRVVGRRSGIAWEQLDLPALRRSGVVAGFFNTVPLRGRGYVTMLHDAQVFTAPTSYARPTRLWRQALSRRAGAAGNALLTVSDYSRDELVRLGIASAERIGVVHNGLGPVAHVTPDETILTRLGLRPRGYGLALASVLPHKNIALLFNAFADPSLQNLPLVLFGSAGRDAFLEAGMTPPDTAIFAGRVRDEELAALYRGAQVVLTPSTTEGFGLPPLEGMAHGTPAVVAPCGAMPEVVGDAALFAPPHDAGAWVTAIETLRRHPETWADLAQRGKARAAHFTWNRAARTALSHVSRWFANGPG